MKAGIYNPNTTAAPSLKDEKRPKVELHGKGLLNIKVTTSVSILCGLQDMVEWCNIHYATIFLPLCI